MSELFYKNYLIIYYKYVLNTEVKYYIYVKNKNCCFDTVSGTLSSA